MAFLRSLQVEEMALTSKSRKYGFVAWMLSTSVGLSLSFLSKSSVLLGISLTMPLMVACLSVAVPIWMHNRYQFWFPQLCGDQARDPRFPRMKGFILWICLVVFAGSVMALGAIISSKPLDDLKYKLFSAKGNNFMSPYTSSVYLGWAMASGIALVVTAILPIVSWFATYRFSHSSAISLVIFSVVLVAFCGTSYLEVVKSRDDRLPTKGDFLAALLPLACIPSLLSLCCGMIKWKDDCWILSRGVYVFVSIGLVLLFGAIAAVIIVIRPWTIGVSFLLVLLLIVVAIGVIHLWASNNFYLTRKQTSSVCFLPFLLGLVAFLVGWFQDKAFAGASVGYFTFLFLLAGRALAVSSFNLPQRVQRNCVVYSPRVLPVYVYDAHADCGKNVSAAFLVLYGIALAAEGWGVVASLIVYPPFAGAAVSAITLVVSFGFAVSRPCLTLEMMEVAVRFLSKDTVVQAISRSATKTRNALSGSYSAPQRSASSAALLVEDPSAMRDKAGNFVLPRDDVMKLRHRLKNEERVAGSFFYRMQCRKRLRHDPPTNVDYRRDMCAHAKVLALEEAIDTEWVYMWDKFGGYLLLLLGLTAKAERVQDEVRLRLFLDSIGFSDLSAKKICKWKPEDRRHFEIIQESYLREKEMEEEILMQRREEEGRGKERRKALLEKEERKWKEIEASLIPSIPNAGSREASAMAAAIRAVGGDSVLEDSFARERVCGIARRIRTAQLDRRAQLTGIAGAVCVLDDEPMISGKHCGQMDASVCQSQKISFSITAMIQPDSGPVCLFGTEYQKQVCWEILVAGSEQGIEAGLVGLRLITKGEKQTTVAREWYIGATSITDGRWHTVTITIDADAGEATCYLDGGFDGYQTGLPLSIGNAIWEQGAEVWLDEAASLHAAIGVADLDMIDLADDNWQWTDSPPRADGWDSDPADVDLYDRDDVDWDGQCSSGRKRRSGRDFVLSGRLGDCWFLSAVAVLTEVSQISEVIITPEYNEEGIYTVRFCIQGEWVPVVIDDWIPCESPGKPAFATSKRLNELWVSIVEKAYAKLHGSYEALEGGLVQDALVDLTGEGFLLGAGSPSGSDVHVSSSGIVQGHAYSVLQVREVDGHRLVQIRNPWANEVEWNGPWSDSSPERSDRMKHKLKHVLQVLSLVTYPFALKYVCVLIMRVQQSNEVDGQWRNCSAGGCQDYSSWHQNPQFLLRATGSDASLPIHVFITLTQLFYIGMRILKTRGHRPSYNIFLHESVGGTDYVNSREISCEMVLDPDPKGYTIVPTTIHPGEEAPFVLSVFTRASVVLEALNQTVHFSMVKTCLPAQRNNRGASDLIAGHFLVKLGGL
uniref:Calpain catalytic domain-containing protein n=1 Tax=Brassica oleracea var. oleracea TaxID=109376 RepID=A0A0D3BN76_BRAOL